MADETVLAASLLPSGRSKLMHVRRGAERATFHMEPFVRSGDVMRDGTAIFRRDPAAVYVVCNRLLDPETNEHCEFDGRVLLDDRRRYVCPGCRRNNYAAGVDS